MGPSKFLQGKRQATRFGIITAVILVATVQMGCSAAKAGSSTSSAQVLLSASSSSVSFGNVPIGSVKTVPVSLTNTGTQNATIQVSQVSVSGAGFNATGVNPPIILVGGQKLTLSVSFMPSSSGNMSGSISVISTATEPTTTITLSGTGTSAVAGQLSVNPASLSFGSIQVGSSKTLAVTLANPAGQGASIQVSQIAASGTGFSVVGATLPLTLAVGQSLTLNVMFNPAASGTDAGTLTIVSDASNPTVDVALSGAGTSPGQLTVSPGTVSFGNVNVGTSQSQTGTLTAGSNGIVVSSASWNGAGFTLSGIAFPVTLTAGQSVPFSVTFDPQSAGSSSGSVTFISNASNSPSSEQWTGTGSQAAQHSVSLSWVPSVSSVQGYYVYRGPKNGGPYSKLSTLDAGLAYTDANVVSGQTYYYVVTALGTDNVESGDSNQVVAVIP